MKKIIFFVLLAFLGLYIYSLLPPETISRNNSAIIDELQVQVESLQTSLNTYSNQLDELNQAKNELEAELNNLATNEDLSNQAELITSLTTQVNTLSGQITTLTQEKTQLQTSISELNSTILNLTTENASQSETITSLNGQITNLNSQITNLNSQITNLNTQITSLQSQLEGLQGDTITFYVQVDTYASLNGDETGMRYTYTVPTGTTWGEFANSLEYDLEDKFYDNYYLLTPGDHSAGYPVYLETSYDVTNNTVLVDEEIYFVVISGTPDLIFSEESNDPNEDVPL